jgi:mannose-1-phosphate guanylyltransferase
MAGGRGTRFWPRSRRRHAKQVLNVLGERSLIRETVDRLAPLLPPERIWVITNDYLRDEIVRQLPEVPPAQILAEPAQRNTAPCIGLAARILSSIDPEAVMGVFPSDQVIGDRERFLDHAAAAFRSAEQGRMVVLGIQPRWPETGYGYVEFPEGVQAGSLEPADVLRFHEKPDLQTAEEYFAAGRFFWNSGMFFWRAGTFLDSLRRHLPKTATILAALPGFTDASFLPRLREAFPLCENISVDYAVLEKAQGVVGIPAAGVQWNDVGSWDAVYLLLPHDEQANAARSELVAQSSSGNYVDAGGKLVALLGVKDLIVVDTPDALLIADRACAQKVGELVKILEKGKREDLL